MAVPCLRSLQSYPAVDWFFTVTQSLASSDRAIPHMPNQISQLERYAFILVFYRETLLAVCDIDLPRSSRILIVTGSYHNYTQ